MRLPRLSLIQDRSELLRLVCSKLTGAHPKHGRLRLLINKLHQVFQLVLMAVSKRLLQSLFLIQHLIPIELVPLVLVWFLLAPIWSLLALRRFILVLAWFQAPIWFPLALIWFLLALRRLILALRRLILVQVWFQLAPRRFPLILRRSLLLSLG